MAEAYDAAMRRRLGIIGEMGTSANQHAQQLNARRPGMIGGGQQVRSPGNIGAGQGYGGPRGNMQALIAFGKFLQGQGFRVSENSYFNGGRRITGGHTRGSRHYSDRAIDVNYGPGGKSRQEQQAIDRIVRMAQQYGLRSIWRAPGHEDHAHFDF